ncbi:hypothetical protein PanWU01x14_083730, partial [Parasponia andersonii]
MLKQYNILRQGSINIDEYYARFVELSQYAHTPGNYSRLQVVHFRTNLRLEIHTRLELFPITTLIEGSQSSGRSGSIVSTGSGCFTPYSYHYCGQQTILEEIAPSFCRLLHRPLEDHKGVKQLRCPSLDTGHLRNLEHKEVRDSPTVVLLDLAFQAEVDETKERGKLKPMQSPGQRDMISLELEWLM